MKVFDWEIPLEWNIKDSYIEHLETGQKFAQFSDSNLHIVSYSEPINTTMDLEELTKHIHTLKEQPNLIPYMSPHIIKKTGDFAYRKNLSKNFQRASIKYL